MSRKAIRARCKACFTASAPPLASLRRPPTNSWRAGSCQSEAPQCSARVHSGRTIAIAESFRDKPGLVPRRKKRAHWCWSCDRVLANERFSGRGHARHICRSCAKLGVDELQFRQAIEGDPSTDEASWIEVQQDCIELFLDGELAWDVWVANGPDGPIPEDTEPELP